MKTAMIHRIAGGLLIAALTLSAVPAGAAPACPPSRPEVTVTLAIAEPSVDNTQPQPALQKLAGKGHLYGRTQGLYRADLEVGWRANVHHDAACRWIEAVTVTINIPARVIYIAHERPPGSCPYESVLAHERKHQAADEAVLAEHRPRIKRAAEEAATLPPIAASDGPGKAVDAQLTGPIAAALKQGFAELAKARAERQAEIDTPAEYRRVHAQCG
jgi:hypothetical protein